MIKENNDISFSVLHLNIRSLNKNFESLKNLLFEINFCFKVICITESCCSDDLHTNNRYQLPIYVSIHQVRKNGKIGGGITIFIHKELIYDIRRDLSVKDGDTNFKVRSYCNTAFSHIFIPIINKPTCDTNHNATIIDHILANSFDSKIDTGILKVDISDHFQIFFSSKSINVKTSQDPVFATKHDISPFTLSLLKEKVLKVDWGLLHTIKDPNEFYKKFSNVFSNLYEIAFPKIKMKVNSKYRISPWITRGLLKSSKRKQRLYEKFLKNGNYVNEEN